MKYDIPESFSSPEEEERIDPFSVKNIKKVVDSLQSLGPSTRSADYMFRADSPKKDFEVITTHYHVKYTVISGSQLDQLLRDEDLDIYNVPVDEFDLARDDEIEALVARYNPPAHNSRTLFCESQRQVYHDDEHAV